MGIQAKSSTRNKVSHQPETILVVDDEPEVCKLVQRLLRHDRFRVLRATSGRSALAKLRRRSVDLVILDIRMPDLDGLQVLERLRRLRKTLPVLMLTAYGHLDTARQAMQLGAYDYVTKPFSIELMKKIVHEALQKPLRRQ
jgi:two-component system response regulator PilR (NtrC family)